MSVEAIEVPVAASVTEVVGDDAVSSQRLLNVLRGVSRVCSIFPTEAPARMSEHFGHAEPHNNLCPDIDLSKAR